MHYLTDYEFFLAKIITEVVAILILIAAVFAIIFKSKTTTDSESDLKIQKLNTQWQTRQKKLQKTLLPKKSYKNWCKEIAQQEKQQIQAQEKSPKSRLFVLDFDGDIKASAVVNLREEITALLTIATSADEIVLRLESAGGIVHGYGLAASQLQRIRAKDIPLTVIIDKVAASGGYLMACVANKILAAPFAIIGSIGVVAQLPNFHRWLRKHAIDFEQITAGEYKRTLTVFGKNNTEKREKMQHELEVIHHYFKDFIQENRPQVNVATVATGEHWLASKALDLQLVDGLTTSDDYLFSASRHAEIFMVTSQHKQTLKNKLMAWFAQMTSTTPSHF